MKTIFYTVALVANLAISSVFGQGTLIVDQQSTSQIATFNASDVVQSFTPSLSSINFVQLQVWDESANSSEQLFVNLLAGSSTGPIIGTTTPINTPSTYLGFATLFFPNSVTLTPGNQYFIQPVGQGNYYDLSFVYGNIPYAGGNMIINGTTLPDSLSFLEGIEVPEPSALALVGLGGLALLIARRKAVTRVLISHKI